MSRRDSALAVLVAVLWGLNFVAVDLALESFPPFWLAALRYLVVAVPVLLLVPRPGVRWHWLLGYGFGFGVAQFGLLFLAIDRGMPAGLSSVVLQMGVPMVIALGAVLLGEQPTGRAVAGGGLAVAGLAIIGWERLEGPGALVPFGLTLLAALGWALGSLSSRLAQPDSPLRFALWMTVVPPVPLLLLSMVMEGPRTGWDATVAAVRGPDVAPLLALLYIVLLGTVVSAALWSALLKTNPAGTVAPFSMLVPVVGMCAAWIALGERSSQVSVVGAGVVLLGVAVATVGRAAAPRPGLRTDASVRDTR
ncbi:EamA family transporter [Jannaschia sp. R86511]|uniref:EamA family transporter n=1 Tax=Jannaschia sp. R86511 TaxID=3093853 RepID=UPI0036D353B3